MILCIFAEPQTCYFNEGTFSKSRPHFRTSPTLLRYHFQNPVNISRVHAINRTMGYGIGMDSCKHTVLSLDRLFFQTILRCMKSLDIPDDCGWRSDPYNWFSESFNDLADGTT